MSSPQASTVSGGEPREDPLEEGTSFDEKEFVRKLLEACSNTKQEKFNFEDYVTQKARGLEDLHPKRRQKCYAYKYVANAIPAGMLLTTEKKDEFR